MKLTKNDSLDKFKGNIESGKKIKIKKLKNKHQFIKIKKLNRPEEMNSTPPLRKNSRKSDFDALSDDVSEKRITPIIIDHSKSVY